MTSSNMKSSKRLLILIIFIIIVAIGGFLIYKEGTLPPDATSKSAKIFVINKGDGLTTIARNLHNEGFIRNRVVFYLVVKELSIEKKIQAGDFRLSPAMSAYEVANALTHGTVDIWVTIVEGLRKEEVAQVISQNFEIPESEFISKSDEGYLFPDTYLIPRLATAESIISIMNNNFDTKYDAQHEVKAKKLGFTKQEVITLASLVEREARTPVVKQQIASILLRRLKEDMPLQIDATVQYALGYQPDEKSWWKKDLSLDDLKIKSPYNTYINTGLPPGPICNPGLASIDAVVDADANTPYLFYITDSQGRIHYARTSAEHEANIKKYLK